MDKVTENIIEIAWIDNYLQAEGKYNEDIDSMEEKLAIIELAERFEKENADIEWGGPDNNYYDEIWKFATKELLERFGK